MSIICREECTLSWQCFTSFNALFLDGIAFLIVFTLEKKVIQVTSCKQTAFFSFAFSGPCIYLSTNEASLQNPEIVSVHDVY